MISCWGACRKAAEEERGSVWGSETEWDRNYSSPVWSFAECGISLSLLSQWQEWQVCDEREYCIRLFSDAQTSDSDVPCLSCYAPAQLRWETVFLALSAKLVNSCMSRQGPETCWRWLWDQSRHMITRMKTNLKFSRVHCSAQITPQCMLTRIRPFSFHLVSYIHIFMYFYHMLTCCFTRKFLGWVSFSSSVKFCSNQEL